MLPDPVAVVWLLFEVALSSARNSRSRRAKRPGEHQSRNGAARSRSLSARQENLHEIDTVKAD